MVFNLYRKKSKRIILFFRNLNFYHRIGFLIIGTAASSKIPYTKRITPSLRHDDVIFSEGLVLISLISGMSHFPFPIDYWWNKWAKIYKTARKYRLANEFCCYHVILLTSLWRHFMMIHLLLVELELSRRFTFQIFVVSIQHCTLVNRFYSTYGVYIVYIIWNFVTYKNWICWESNPKWDDHETTVPERDLECNDILPVLGKFLLPMFSRFLSFEWFWLNCSLKFKCL